MSCVIFFWNSALFCEKSTHVVPCCAYISRCVIPSCWILRSWLGCILTLVLNILPAWLPAYLLSYFLDILQCSLVRVFFTLSRFLSNAMVPVHHVFFWGSELELYTSPENWFWRKINVLLIADEKCHGFTYTTKHNATQDWNSDDFGLRSPVIQKLV